MNREKKVIGVMGKNVGLKKINAQKVSSIIMPDSTVQKSLMAIVECVGPNVENKSLRKNSTVISDGYNVKQLHITGSGNVTLLAKEDHIMMIKIAGVWYPYGKFSLIERINEEIQTEAKIIIPACYDSTDQSMYGVFSSGGYHNGNHIDIGVSPGEIVHIKEWDIKIKEVELDGKYHLIVPNKLIDFKCSKETMISNIACH